MGILQRLYEMNAKIAEAEARLWQQNYSMARVALSYVSKNWQHDKQQPSLFGVYKAICVDTIDPLVQGGVRFYCPLIDSPTIETKQLPFAYPISPFGGFDDCGVTWVPPAGSTLMLLFEGGHRSSPYYIGTIWSRDRGQPPHNFGVTMKEFDKFHSGKRDGYIVGPNNSQIFPPWNTENANIKDIDDIKTFESDTEAQRKVKIAHVYGMKTPQKHRLKFVDGQYECNFRWKRVELASGDGNWLMFKDDHLHEAGQWAHEQCNCTNSGSQLDDCTDENGNPKEQTSCNSDLDGGKAGNQLESSQSACGNPNFKRAEECRPYKGPGTPENNKCELHQSGWQICSISGQTIWADDSVEEPRDPVKWQRSLEDFDYGCTDRFMGRIAIKSSTGHILDLNDIEDEAGKKERGEKNGARIITATGNSVILSDHTLNGIGGSERGIKIESTSTAHLYLVDEGNNQKSPDRKSGGTPEAKATKAYVELKSGYGLELLMRDDNSQEETQTQFIRLMAPQKSNTTRGPHILWMQEAADGPGLVLLHVGGNFVGVSYDEWVEMVGSEDENPASKIEIITDSKVESIKESYFNKNKNTIIWADEFMALLAGQDCVQLDGSYGPCIGPAIIMNPSTGKLGLSDRLFGSISPDAQDVTLAMISQGAF